MRFLAVKLNDPRATVIEFVHADRHAGATVRIQTRLKGGQNKCPLSSGSF